MSGGLPDGVVEIGFHVLKYKVKIFIVFSPDDLMQLNDVGIMNFLEEDDLAVGPLGVS